MGMSMYFSARRKQQLDVSEREVNGWGVEEIAAIGKESALGKHRVAVGTVGEPIRRQPSRAVDRRCEVAVATRRGRPGAGTHPGEWRPGHRRPNGLDRRDVATTPAFRLRHTQRTTQPWPEPNEPESIELPRTLDVQRLRMLVAGLHTSCWFTSVADDGIEGGFQGVAVAAHVHP